VKAETKAFGFLNLLKIFPRYKAGLVLVLFLLLGNGNKISAQCASGGDGTDGFDTGVRQVIFNTINNSSPLEDVAYSDFTGISTNVGHSSSYDLSVYVNTEGDWTINTVAWIDWNQDLDFDDAGETYSLGSATNVVAGLTALSPLSITVPGTAALGSTIMRVSAKWDSDPTSCETGFDGEVEDYTINVVAPEINIQGNALDITDGDITPGTADDTDYGTVYSVSGSVSHTFTIFNTGGLDLSLSGSPYVNITGTHASDFSVTTQPGNTIASGGGSETFVVAFDPAAEGVRSATISIANTDDDENPYTFDIQGTGSGPPEMDISGNSTSIFDGDTSPSVNDDTYFGSADIVTGFVDHSFTISNSGSSILFLTGNPIVTLSGSHASNFSVTSQPAASIGAGGGVDVFAVRFDPDTSGIRTATVSISSSDPDESPYTFTIQGTGTATPEMDVSGNSISIVDGTTSTSTSDDTDFGNTDINTGSTVHTFSVSNSGSGDLTLSGSPRVSIFGAQASDFTVSQQPASATVSPQGGTQTFQITFDPPTTGLRQAFVSITNNDANESPYTFNIQGTGTINPEIDIQGNGVSIVSGDNTPSAVDSTIVGTVQVGDAPNIITYTIHNSGPATLNLTGSWPLIAVSGINAGDFSVYSAPSSSIVSGGSTTFQIAFDPLTASIRSAILTIDNNDLDEGSYSFAIQGTGTSDGSILSEIDIQGNLVSIVSGDATPSLTDGTDMGLISVAGGSVVQAFMINNLGTDDLVLASVPMVTVSGVNAADFSITQQPSTPVSPAGSVPFNVSFNPSGAGLRSAIISVENNDNDENPYTFTVQGFGLTFSEIEIRGNGLEISTGDASPSMLDSTYFGDITPSLGNTHVTFTIYNTGDSTLALTGSPVVTLVGDAVTEFTVTSMPSSSIAPGGSSDFVVQFDPIQIGLRNVSVSITSNDNDESPYAFALQGNGTGPGSPLACVPNFFHIFGDNGTVAYLDATTSPYTYTTITSAGYSINGMGYNTEDGLLYGFEMDADVAGNKIIRIDGQGTLVVLSSVSIPYESWRADFNSTGDMYFWNEAGNEISIFDASEGTVVSQSTTGTVWLPIDMAYLNEDGKFYGIHTSLLYKYDPVTNSVTTSSISGRLTDDYGAGANSAYYGAAWSANDGYIYTTNSESGGMYKINVTTGESVFVGQAEADLLKSDGASCPLSEAPLPLTGSVGDKVWIDSDGDGVQDAGETGLPGVDVALYGKDNPFIAATTTDANGEYAFTNLAPSEYYIIFSGGPAGFGLTLQDQGGNDVTDSDADPATGQTADFFVAVGSIEVGMDAGYTATGLGDFVWNDLNEDGVQDFGEPGLPNVTVQLLDAAESVLTTTITDANGRYSFSALAANTYKIKAVKPNGFKKSPQNAGGDDALDSDIGQGEKTGNIVIGSGVFDATVDAGLFQDKSPNMNVTGNSQDIVDGDVSPSVTDHTDFTSVSVVSGTIVRTFTIENVILAAADLTLNGTPVVDITGTNASDFTVTTSPATSIDAGTSTTFQVSFDPSGGGLRSAVVSILNTDLTKNPYDFDIQGIGLAPEIGVDGNGQAISHGDVTPTTDDDTDFGSHDIDTGSSNSTYTIQNTGNAALDLTAASPYVVISGAHASDFSITANPSTPIAEAGTTTFDIHFDPSAVGLRTATLSIASNDVEENPFTFDIQGTGTVAPEIALQGNLVNISNGDSSPSVTDSTDFGSLDIFVPQDVHSFSILNTGSGDLTLSGLPYVQLTGTNAGDFIISQQPASATISPAGSLTFQVAFNPTTTGLRQASIVISNDDSDENPFSFDIQGLGTSTMDEEIEVLGNGNIIESGDNFPSGVDFTEMGVAEISGVPATATFVIRNVGYAVLNLTGPPPYVSISGSHASEFIITNSPANTVAIDSATTSFEVGFNPAALGVRQALISIQNDDSDENPYTFTIQGTGVYDPDSQSEIKVQGNMLDILDGDLTPAVADGTDFESIEVVGGFTASQEFIVHNIGPEDLVLGSTPIIVISGTNAADFTVTSEPATLVAPSSTVAFTVEFNPSSTGLREATISIGNSDQDENPYTFNIQGTGTTAPEISVSGNGLTISSGDSSPGTADSTYFGDVDVSLGNRMITYTIYNNGSSSLNFTGNKVTMQGTNSADFNVSTYPAASVSVGGNTTFVIEFDALVVGLRNATISITSNDPDLPTYWFDIQGNGTGAGSPLACEPNFYQVYGSSGTIAYLNANTSPYTYTTLATAGYIIDGIGYNLQDGLIYGFEMGVAVASDRIVRIDAAGAVTVLSSISIPYSSSRADFDDDGNLYFWNAGGTDLSVFDASTGVVSSNIGPSGTFLAADMAFRSTDSKFYGVSDSTLYIYDPSLNSVSSSIMIQGKLNDDLVAGTNGNAFGSAWSASDGYVYVANELSGRMYKINVTTNPASSVYVGQASVVSNSDGASCPVSDSPLPTTGTIGDKVWLDNNGDGIQDAGEAGLAGVTVSLYEADDTFLTSLVTSSTGIFSFGSLGASQYYLTFTTPPTGFSLSPKAAGANDALDSDADPSTGKTDNIEITPGVVNNSIDAGFRATGVGDYVWLDVNEDGIQDGNENGVPGINVEIKIDGGSSVATTTTDANGKYSFTGLAVNTYRLYFTNLAIGYAFSPQNQGADDALDNDIGSNGQSAAFALGANVYDNSLDAGVFQSSEPEVSVTGNNVNIADGDFTPSTLDHTDFGSVNAAIDSVVYTFWIHNAISGATLTLNGTPKISVSGTAAADFVLTSAPADTVSPGDSTYFSIRFIASAEGLRSATLNIANTDADENPFDFNVRGIGLASEIQIEGNGQVISDGDTTATATNFTDFGAEDILTGSQAQIFTILNTGNADLVFTDPAPYITITGNHAADFSITNAPSSPIISNNSTTFTITFDPEAEGLRNATVSLANNDLDENPFTFTIQGIGLATPEITVGANNELIADGDTSPIVTDNTDFGSNDILTDTQVNSFLIINTGSGSLELTGTPIVILSGGQAGDFLVSQQPASSTVAAGDTVTFDVTFDPTAVGLRSASVSIATDDADENPFNFSIQGNGVAGSQLKVLGNNTLVANGDMTPSLLDSTVFDSTNVDSAFSVTFTIKNPGSAILNLTGATPYVTISGAHSSDFSITQIPSSVITADGGTTLFRITFIPGATGERTATVSIVSDDVVGGSPYTFGIMGVGIPAPQPQLTLVETVDLSVAAPGDTLTYTIIYSNVGPGLATDVVVDEEIPANSTYLENSATGVAMTITYSHDNGGNYNISQTAPVTNIKYELTTPLAPGGNGTVVFKVVID